MRRNRRPCCGSAKVPAISIMSGLAGKTGVPSLEDGKHLSELNLNLVRKIAKIDPSVATS